MIEPAPLLTTDLRLPGRRAGKVRDLYDLPQPKGQPPRVLIVASDRISAFDVVMPTPIPGKGRLLTEIAAFWLGFIHTHGLAKTHLLSSDANLIPPDALTPSTTLQALQGRVMIGLACRVLPVEFVVRGYLEGSGWKDYQDSGSVCGHALPVGLRQCDRLPQPLLTPATKAPKGHHDENITPDQARATVDALAGPGAYDRIANACLNIYRAAADHAQRRGIILADTKFEFGLPLGPNGQPDPAQGPILIDEALTPDSSRFWPADLYQPGRPQRSFDKQFLREHLEALAASGAWNKAHPGPALPEPVVAGTLDRYRRARDLLLS